MGGSTTRAEDCECAITQRDEGCQREPPSAALQGSLGLAVRTAPARAVHSREVGGTRRQENRCSARLAHRRAAAEATDSPTTGRVPNLVRWPDEHKALPVEALGLQFR